MMLRGQKGNLAIRSLNRARLAATARRSDSLIHGGSESVVGLRDLPAFPRGAIASVPYVSLDEVDVVEHGVKNVLLRGDSEFPSIEARC